VVTGAALRVDAARVGKCARVHAGPLFALFVGLAVVVPPALDVAALHLGVPLQPLRAQTHGTVVGHTTLGGSGTTGLRARVNTLTPHAGGVPRTIGV